MQHIEKIACYVDETGQDTEGNFFIVSVVVSKNKDELLQYLEEVEKKSGKGKFKWGRADPEKRWLYLDTILTQKKFPLKIYYSVYKNTKEYKASTIITIAKAVRAIKNYQKYKFLIYVDGLGQRDQRFYGSQLHKLGIPSKKVKGVKRDESNALIRFADSMCGFIRDVVQLHEKRLVKLYNQVKSTALLIEV